MSMSACVVCFDECLEVPGAPTATCLGCDSVICEACSRAHLHTILAQSYTGMVPRLSCAVCVKQPVPFQRWSRLLDETEVRLLTERSKEALHLQCWACHKSSTLFVPEGKGDGALLSPPLRAASEAYARNDLDEGGLLAEVGADVDEAVVVALLGSITDPARRASFHLRLLRARPRVLSSCCRAPHCFTCQIQGFHPGLTCAQVAAKSGNQDVLPCPSCGVSLAKADGCNKVVCPCGSSFDWAEELRKQHVPIAHQFAEEHSNPAHAAAEALYHGKETAGARAYSYEFPDALKEARSEIWGKRHNMYAAQAALFTQTQLPPSHRDHVLARSWSQLHKNQIAQAKAKQKEACALRFSAVYGKLAPSHAILAMLSPSGTKLVGRRAHSAYLTFHEREIQVEAAAMRHRFSRAWEFLCSSPSPNVHATDVPAMRALEMMGELPSSSTSSTVGDTIQRAFSDFCRVEQVRLDRARAIVFLDACAAIGQDPSEVALDIEETKLKPSRSQKRHAEAWVACGQAAVLEKLGLKRRLDRSLRFQVRHGGSEESAAMAVWQTARTQSQSSSLEFSRLLAFCRRRVKSAKTAADTEQALELLSWLEEARPVAALEKTRGRAQRAESRRQPPASTSLSTSFSSSSDSASPPPSASSPSSTGSCSSPEDGAAALQRKRPKLKRSGILRSRSGLHRTGRWDR